MFLHIRKVQVVLLAKPGVWELIRVVSSTQTLQVSALDIPGVLRSEHYAQAPRSSGLSALYMIKHSDKGPV